MNSSFDQQFISDIINFDEIQSVCQSPQQEITIKNAYKNQEDCISEQQQIAVGPTLVYQKNSSIQYNQKIREYQQLRTRKEKNNRIDKLKRIENFFENLNQLQSEYKKEKKYSRPGRPRKNNNQQYSKNDVHYQNLLQKQTLEIKKVNQNQQKREFDSKKNEKLQVQTRLNSKSLDQNQNQIFKLKLTLCQEMILSLAVALEMLNSSLISQVFPCSKDEAEQYWSNNYHRLSNQLKYKIDSIHQNHHLIFQETNSTLVLLLRCYFYKIGINLESEDSQQDENGKAFSFYPSHHKPILTGYKWKELKSDF